MTRYGNGMKCIAKAPKRAQNIPVISLVRKYFPNPRGLFSARQISCICALMPEKPTAKNRSIFALSAITGAFETHILLMIEQAEVSSVKADNKA